MLSIGERAPDFTALRARIHDDDPADFTLSVACAAHTAVVLAFFPFAFSPGCFRELIQFRMNADEYRQLDTEVIGCSGDSVFALAEFARQTECPWPLVSDWNRTVAASYDALRDLPDGTKDVCKRLIFVIDAGRVIRYVWEGQGHQLPNDEDILSLIRSL